MRQGMLLTPLLMLLMVSAGAQGFLFPDEHPAPEASTDPPTTAPTAPESSPAQAEEDTEDYGDYGPTVDPGEEGVLEERFFFGKDVSAKIGRKLGHAASSLLNTLTSRDESSPSLPPQPKPKYPSFGSQSYDTQSYGAPPYGAPSYGSPSYGVAPGYPGAPGYSGAPAYPRGPTHEEDTDYPQPGYGGPPIYPGAPVYGDAQRFSGKQGYGDAVVPGGDPGYGGDQSLAGYAPGTQDYSDGAIAVPDYPDLAPEADFDTRFRHGFPVDALGRILCVRVPRRRKKACRKARRQQRRRGGGGPGMPRPGAGRPTTAAPVTCPSVPDKQAMTKAQESCCGLQQKGDLYGFNNCCQTLGFCPVCEVDSEKLAHEECCPILHEGDNLGYRRCCSRFGTCPECGPPPTPEPEGPVGCLYKGKLYPVGEVMDRIAFKCMFVNCKDNGAGPETVLEYLDKVGCCEMTGKSLLYPPGHSLPKDDCTNLVCENGEWERKATDAAAIFTRPCPEGWLDLGGSCVFIWRELMTFNNATIACGKLRSSLVLLENRAQLTQLINAFRDMEDRDSTRELGGWVNAQFSDRQWQTLQGDTLAFAPWEQGYPDDLRRTNCAGLTVTERSKGWKDYMCDNRANMLYPICQVRKPDCGEIRDGCGPYDGDMMFTPGSEVSIFSSECERFMCNEDSYVVRHVNKQCCYRHEWNGEAFGRNRGWYTGLFPPGGFEMFEGMLCECTDGESDCQQFF